MQNTSHDDWQAVEADGRVRLLPAACIALRFHESSCNHCRSACPVDCIDIGAGKFSVGAQCLGCGHCAAACPTGALAIKGFGLREQVPDPSPLRVECQKVDRRLAGAALRVPCLGGMAPADWLELSELSGLQAVHAIDRGWCTQCSAGAQSAGPHPAAAGIEKAAQWLKAAGVPESSRPRLIHEPLPAMLMPPHIPDAAPAAPARRGFLLRLGHEAKRAIGIDTLPEIPTPHALRRSDLMPLPAQVRLFRLFQGLAALVGRPVSPTPFHVVEIGQACADHTLCAGMCPTAALRRYEAADQVGIEFDMLRCIGCGQCATACPEQAVTLHQADTLPSPDAALRLTAHSLRTCAQCLQTFTDSSGNTLCPSCRRNHAMAADLFKGS